MVNSLKELNKKYGVKGNYIKDEPQIEDVVTQSIDTDLDAEAPSNDTAMSLEKLNKKYGIKGDYTSSLPDDDYATSDYGIDTYDMYGASDDKLTAIALVMDLASNGVKPSAKQLNAAGITYEQAFELMGNYGYGPLAKTSTTEDTANDKLTSIALVMDLVSQGAKPTAKQLNAAGITYEQAFSMMGEYGYGPLAKTSTTENEGTSAYDQVWDFIYLGAMPSDELIEKSGMSKSDVQLAVAAVEAYYGGSSEETTTQTPTPTPTPTPTQTQSPSPSTKPTNTPKQTQTPKPTTKPTTQPTPQSDPDDMSDYKVRNTNADSWVSVSGFGRLSWQELATMVEKGTVIETVDTKNKTIHYKKA